MGSLKKCQNNPIILCKWVGAIYFISSQSYKKTTESPFCGREKRNRMASGRAFLGPFPPYFYRVTEFLADDIAFPPPVHNHSRGRPRYKALDNGQSSMNWEETKIDLVGFASAHASCIHNNICRCWTKIWHSTDHNIKFSGWRK